LSIRWKDAYRVLTIWFTIPASIERCRLPAYSFSSTIKSFSRLQLTRLTAQRLNGWTGQASKDFEGQTHCTC
jgi:hypothetical protein